MRKAKAARAGGKRRALAAFLQHMRISSCFPGKKSGVGLAAPATEPFDADAATWAAVEATHGSLAACTLAHVQALSVASAAVAVRFGSVDNAGKGR